MSISAATVYVVDDEPDIGGGAQVRSPYSRSHRARSRYLRRRIELKPFSAPSPA